MAPSIYPHFHMNQEVPDATLESFCDGSRYFLSFTRLMAKFTEMDHVPIVETLCQLLAILSNHSLDKITYNTFDNKNPKDQILIWDTGASFGLTPFRSGFIDYVGADIHVKDVTNINQVIRIGTMLHKFQNYQGEDIFLPFVSYHIPTIDVRLFSP